MAFFGDLLSSKGLCARMTSPRLSEIIVGGFVSSQMQALEALDMSPLVEDAGISIAFW